MALTNKPLGLATSAQTVYQAGVGVEASVHGLVAHNYSGSPVTLTVNVFNAALATTVAVVSGRTLAAGEVYAYPKPINLQPGDRVEALCSAAGSVNLLSSIYSSATTVAKGFSAKGAWSSAATYTTNDVTSRNGAAYGALRDNTNADPLTSPSDWALLLDSPRKVVMLAADVTNNNATANTMADVTGLSFAVTAGKSYRFKAVIPYTSAATTTGSRWAINGPATSALSYKSQYTLTATTETTNHVAAYDSPAAANATSLTTGNNAVIEGTLTAAANGTVVVRFASEIANSAITAKAGAYIESELLN